MRISPVPVLVLALSGCAESGAVEETAEDPSCVPLGVTAGDAALAEFVLDDRNETSPTHGQDLTPRCYLDRVSAWYMLDAT